MSDQPLRWTSRDEAWGSRSDTLHPLRLSRDDDSVLPVLVNPRLVHTLAGECTCGLHLEMSRDVPSGTEGDAWTMEHTCSCGLTWCAAGAGASIATVRTERRYDGLTITYDDA